MDARQDDLANPFGMDEDCENCRLCRTRDRIVHGYGPVDADFLFVGEMPSEQAELTGVPFRGTVLWSVLGELGFAEDVETGEPVIRNAYLTHLTRCRNPDRHPEDDEIAACDPFLSTEIRMINPEVLVPVGERALRALVAEYTTTDSGSVDISSGHGSPIRGRGFELLPCLDPEGWTQTQRDSFVAALEEILGRDYRQTKGRRGRAERERSE